jgi:hypothetical protein
MIQTMLAPRFALGQLVATPGAMDALNHTNDELLQMVRRHRTGDWGDLCEEDRQANEMALMVGSRLLSAYHTASGEKVWIITESDRSYTTILLPSEY